MDSTGSNADSENCTVSLRNGGEIKARFSSIVGVQSDTASIKSSSGHTVGVHQAVVASKSVAGAHDAEHTDGSRDDMLVGEDGELDYDEDEGEEEKTDKSIAPAELEEGELEEEGEEGEILSGEENKVLPKKNDKEDGEINENDLEEGELLEPGEYGNRVPKKLCRYYSSGSCTWGVNCRFLHPGVNDKGAYHMLPQPGQYPSPFPKVSPVVQEAVKPVSTQQSDEDEDKEDRELPAAVENVMITPKKETAWERGLKRAKEIKKAALRRKEEDADFEQKRMSLGISADVEEEDDKENAFKQRDLRLHMKKAKDSGDYGESSRYRRTRDDGQRWRDNPDASLYPRQDKDRRKRRSYRDRSASADRETYSRSRTAAKLEKNRAKEKERSREKKSDEEKKREERSSHRDKPLEKESAEDKKPKASPPNTDKEKETASKGKVDSPKDTELKEAEGREEAAVDAAREEQEKQNLLAISATRLPNDTWHDPWQRTTSPKRRLSRNSSTSSRSSQRRSSSSSSGSSHSSRSRSNSASGSDSESRSSRSPSRSQSRSVSRSPSHSPSRSGSHSRSASPSSASDRSSTPSSAKSAHDDSPAEGEETRAKGPETPSGPSSVSSSASASSRSPSPQKSPAVERQPPQAHSGAGSAPSRESQPRERGNRYSHGRADRWRHGHDHNAWPRKQGDRRTWEDAQRARARPRRVVSPARGRRSRSPRRKGFDRNRRPRESRSRRRSSSADSMEHALARPSSPRAARDHSNRASATHRTGSQSSKSSSSQESEDESKALRQQRPDRRGGSTGVPLSSGKIRYTGHKDIKLTLNKSASKPKNPQVSPSAARPDTSRATERQSEKPSEKTVDRPAAAKKHTPREPSPSGPSSTSVAEVPASPKAVKRTADSPSDDSKADVSSSTSSRREELLRELKAVEDAIARKRARIE